MSDLSSERFALPHEIPAQARDDESGRDNPSTPPLAAARSPSPSRGDGEDREYAHHFSREKQVRFLEALALWGSVRAACRQVPVAPQTVYRARRASGDFALAWDAAMLVARPHVEDVLSDRALNGVEEPVFYHGEEIARRRRFDSRLLLAHLARLDKAEDRDEVREVAEGFDAALERLARGEPVDPLAGEDDDVDEDDDRPAWMDESVPFVERVMLYLKDIEDEEDGEGQEDDDDDLPDPFACEEEEPFDASKYILRDRVTPVTSPVSAEPPVPAVEPAPAGESEDEPAGGAAPVEERPAAAAPVASTAGPLQAGWQPIWDGRMTRFYGRY